MGVKCFRASIKVARRQSKHALGVCQATDSICKILINSKCTKSVERSGRRDLHPIFRELHVSPACPHAILGWSG